MDVMVSESREDNNIHDWNQDNEGQWIQVVDYIVWDAIEGHG